jgi:3-isopropylmalate dehydrogenase
LPSASLGARRGEGDTRRRGVYEPIHGSAPNIAGKGLANPVGTILSLAMLFRFSLERLDAAQAIESAVTRVIESGKRTPDVADAGSDILNTAEFGAAVASEITSEVQPGATV